MSQSVPLADAAAENAALGTEPIEAAEIQEITGSRFWKRFRQNKLAVIAGIFLLFVVLIAIIAPLLTSYDPILAANFRDRLEPPFGNYLLGTDNVGRDIWTRLVYGARYALIAGVVALLVALGLGVPVGLTIGYYRGWVDRITMRGVEVVVAVPAVVMAMAIISALGAGLVRAMVAIGIVYAMVVARLTRAEVFAAREELYVDGARAAGSSGLRVMFRHILPNVAPALIVQSTLLFAQAILAEAALSFLGLGAGTDQASWGVMLREARDTINETVWPTIPPGVAIFMTVIAFNVFGDGLRDAFAREARGGKVGIGDVERVKAGTEMIDVTDLRPKVAPADADASSQPATTVDADTDAKSSSKGADASTETPILELRNLSIRFPRPGTTSDVTVVRDVSLDIRQGEILALVGESGSGKSITALSLLGLVPSPGLASASSIKLDGRELADLDFDELRSVRGRDIGVIFQEPSAALNPAYTVGRQVAEPLIVHLGMSKKQARARVLELLGRVGIPNPEQRIDAYPHQFSGGMAQRVVIAMALACEPKLLIADEPTTALDVTVQGQVLDLIGNLSEELGVAVLLITHDLGVVADLAHEVAVMYAGEIVERGALDDVFRDPQHPYTEGLIRSIPRNESRAGDLPTIGGVVPPPWQWPKSCHFGDRCAYVSEECRAAPIPLTQSEHSLVRCVKAPDLDLEGVGRLGDADEAALAALSNISVSVGVDDVVDDGKEQQ